MSEELKPCPACGSDDVTVVCDSGSTFAVLCVSCVMRGPRYEDPQDAVEAWNALPRKLRFSREKPSKDGKWYWYRDTEGEPAIGFLRDGCLTFLGGSYVYIDNAPGEFAGPIQEPEEATT